MSEEREPIDEHLVNVDWKAYLNIHFPHLARIFLSKDYAVEMNAKLTSRNKKLQGTQADYFTTLYDHLIRIIEPTAPNDRRTKLARGLLHFLNDQVAAFDQLTSGDRVLFNQLKDQMEDLFRDNEARYLDRVGELLSTVHLIRKFAPARLSSLKHYYTLKNNKIDTKGKDADLCFIKPDGKLVMIDIYNINLNHELIEDEAGLNKILNDRITKKWKEKKFDDPGLTTRYEHIYVQPFLWLYDLDTIEKYNNVLSAFQRPEALPVLAMRQQSDNNENVFYDCVSFPLHSS
jgi:hypothetical protein